MTANKLTDSEREAKHKESEQQDRRCLEAAFSKLQGIDYDTGDKVLTQKLLRAFAVAKAVGLGRTYIEIEGEYVDLKKDYDANFIDVVASAFGAVLSDMDIAEVHPCSKMGQTYRRFARVCTGLTLLSTVEETIGSRDGEWNWGWDSGYADYLIAEKICEAAKDDDATD